MLEKKKLFVLGSVNVDLSISCKQMPNKGETINGFNFYQSLGGKGANQSFYSSELGLTTFLYCSIGDDYFGDFVKKNLNKTKISLKINRIKQAATGKAIIIKSNNDNRIILDQGANYLHNLKKIELAIANSKANFFLTQSEIPFNIVYSAIKFASEKKLQTFLNPAPAIIENEKIYQYLDYLILNEIECQQLAKINPSSLTNKRKAASYFLNLGVKNVIITLGANGSYYQSKNLEHIQKPIKVKVKNTTGAGDSYIGALIWALAENKTIQEAMNIATIIAAKVCASDEIQVRNIKI